MKILLLGPPASGKGTVGDKLSELLHIPVISSGQLVRDLPQDHPRYEEMQKLMKNGTLVPQDFLGELLSQRVLLPEFANGYILDGWGRHMIDLTYFNPGFDKVLALNLSLESAIKRISGRMSCPKCGEVYNIYYIPPKVENICDVCGTELVKRSDDSAEVVEERYKAQWLEAQDVVEKFRKEGILVEVDAEPAPDVVFKNVTSALGIDYDKN